MTRPGDATTAAGQADWLEQLNEPQRAAVTAGDEPLLVVAGAGSGKTRTLAARVAWLIGRGVEPQRILLLTFTRRAADQMLRRAAAAAPAGAAATGQVWGGTFHAIANRLLRIYAGAAGLVPEFTILDQADAEDLLDVIRHEQGLAARGKRFPRKSTCLAIYSRRMNGGGSLQSILQKQYPWCADWPEELAQLYRAYVERKQQRGLLDYDDLLLYWKYLLEDEQVAASISARFDHVLVDEYQDTNALQADILAGMRPERRKVMAVGDDAQSIYSFRSATIRNMLEFPERFPGTRLMKLEQNYRSVRPILDTTNRVIGQARKCHAKQLWSARAGGQRPQLITCRDEAHQDDVVIERILGHYEQGIPLRRQAVLFRAAAHSNSLELALTRRNIPYHKHGGLRFLEAAHIKDVVAMLRILENHRDEPAWFRVLQLLEGIGPASAAAAFAHLGAHGHDPGALASWSAPPAAREQSKSLATLYQELGALNDRKPAVVIDRVRRFYGPILQRVYENPQPRAADLEHLQQLAGSHRSCRRFLAELILDPPTSTGDLAGPPGRDEDWLVLSTIHSAKGCEWDAVYVIHAADGCLPSDMATGDEEEVEEELRLTYVALTRARDFLYVTWPLRYYHTKHRRGDRHSYAQCCRFFTPEVRQTMEQVGGGPEQAEEGPVAGTPAADIGARLREMWG